MVNIVKGYKGLETSRGTTFTMLFNFRTSKLDTLPANVAPRNYPDEYNPLAFTNSDSVKSNIVRRNYKEWIVYTQRYNGPKSVIQSHA